MFDMNFMENPVGLYLQGDNFQQATIVGTT